MKVAGERLSELKDRATEIIQSDNGEKDWKKIETGHLWPM